PLPELRNGCLPWAGAGGGRAVCRYDTEVPIYKGGLQPAKSTNSAESAAVIPAQAGIWFCRCGNLSDKMVSLDFYVLDSRLRGNDGSGTPDRVNSQDSDS
ncbi:TPA: hypothetical protein ACFI7J_002214, partial [Neisseria gonorrhoeae]